MAKHIPDRMCVGCRRMRPKRELVRVVKNSDGEINLDNTGKMPGRGAYICPTQSCLELARKNRALERSFKGAVGAEIYAELKAELNGSESA